MFRRFERERLIAFARFVWQRFVDDKCFETAGALSYVTLFALVPLTVVVFGILSALPSFSDWTQVLTEFVFRNFVPAAGDAVRTYVLQFAGNASKLTGIGIGVLLLSALVMMSSIEERLNRIWRVQTRRSPLSRFMLYWTALTLGPVLVVSGLAVTSYLAALPLLGRVGDAVELKNRLLSVLPFAVSLVGLFCLYVLVPNRRVSRRAALAGALLAAILFEIAKWGFAEYVRTVPSYRQVYGTLAVVPIFLLWIYLSWAIALLGASVAASLGAFDYRPRGTRLPEDAEFIGLLHLLGQFVAAQRQGTALDVRTLQKRMVFVPDDLLQRYLGDLHGVGLIRRTEEDAWVMARSLDSASLMEIYHAGRYRLPLDTAELEPFSEGLPNALHAHLDELAQLLRDRLGTPLAELFPVTRAEPTEHGRT